ncbi:MAG: STAS domain-containing protein [bacterium]
MIPITTDLVEHHGLNVMVARLQGDIDMANAQNLLAEISSAIPNTIAALVVDTSDVAYLDSNGVRLLFELARGMQRRRKPFRVVVPLQVFHRKVLLISGLQKVVPMDDSLDEAFARLGPAAGVGHDDQ